MTRFSRRQFLGSAAAVASAGTVAGQVQAAVREASGPADLIITGATVLSMDPAIPKASAVAVRGRHILAVGSDEDVLNLKGAKTEVVDARGHTVTPGFIDAHSHPLGAADAISANVGLPRIADVQAALAAQAKKTPPGQWVLGSMYDDTRFAEGRPLTRRDLDAAVPGHPVFVSHRGGHTAVVNTAALELAGISAETPDPVGGRYFREGGELTGKIAEPAAFQPFQDAGVWPQMDRAARQRSVMLASQRMAAAGLTSTTDASGSLDDFIAYQDARAAGEMHFRLSFMPGGTSEVYAGLKQARVASGFGDDMLRIGAVKFAADGSASERTMSRSTPYAGRPDDFGILTMTQEEIDAAVDDAVAHDFRIGIHANGDVAIDRVLNAYERVLKDWQGENPRFRIEHCSFIDAARLARIKAAGVVPAPFYTYALLPRKQVGRVRPGHDGVDVRAQEFSRRRHPGGAGLRFSARAVRTDDGAAEHGDADGRPGSRVGREAADLRRRGAQGLHHEWRLRVLRGRHQGLADAGQARGPRDPRQGSACRRPGRDRRHQGPAHDPRRADDLRSLRCG